MSDDETLLPCPFCGDNRPVVHQEPYRHLYSVQCGYCGVECGSWARSKAAVACWNHRRKLLPVDLEAVWGSLAAGSLLLEPKKLAFLFATRVLEAEQKGPEHPWAT